MFFGLVLDDSEEKIGLHYSPGIGFIIDPLDSKPSAVVSNTAGGDGGGAAIKVITQKLTSATTAAKECR